MIAFLATNNDQLIQVKLTDEEVEILLSDNPPKFIQLESGSTTVILNTNHIVSIRFM